LTSSQKIGDGEKAFRNMIIQKMSGATSITNINDSSDMDTNMDSSDTSSQSQQAPLDPSLFFDIKGERSNKSNVPIEKIPEGGDKAASATGVASAGRKGGGDAPTVRPTKNLNNTSGNSPSTKNFIQPTKSLSNNNISDNSKVSNYFINNKSMTKVSNFNINPLYDNTSYESTNSTIIMMQLPQQNNAQPEIQMPSTTKFIPMLNNKSTDVYKKVLTRALY